MTRQTMTTNLAAMGAAVLLLAGCGGGDSSQGNSESNAQPDPQAWFADHCPLTLATTDDAETLAMKQGPIVAIPSNMSEESSTDVLSFYSYDDSTASVEASGEMTADTPFCFKSGEEAVDATDPASGEDAAFYPVSTPTNEDAYVNADQFVGGGDAEGYVFDKGSKQVEAGGGEDSGSNIEIPEDVANIDAAVDNVVDESLDHCELIGSECAF